VTPLPFRYLAYGVGIHSEVALPVPSSPEAPCDLEIRLEPAPAPREAQVDEELIRHAGGTRFLIRGGREIVAYTTPPLDADTVDFLTTGGIGIILHQRGYAVLHASCIRTEHRDLAFIGASGMGKSSMAAAMVAHGMSVISDDFIALTAGQPLRAGFPQLRLLPDTATALAFDAAQSVVNGEWPKATWSFSQVPRDGAHTGDDRHRGMRLYFLQDGPTLDIRPLTPRLALFHLLSNGYCGPLLDREMLATEFHVLSELARTADCWILERPRDFDRIHDVARAVERHARSD
jgi:hypothetical protein